MATKVIFPKSRAPFNKWLAALPSRTMFNIMDSHECVLTQFARTRIPQGTRISVAAPNYWIGDGGNKLLPRWACAVQDQAFDACRTERRNNKQKWSITRRISARALRKHMETV